MVFFDVLFVCFQTVNWMDLTDYLFFKLKKLATVLSPPGQKEKRQINGVLSSPYEGKRKRFRWKHTPLNEGLDV